MGKLYLIFLILSVTLAIEIAALRDEDSDESPVLHVRKKRLIERVNGGPRQPPIEEFGHATKLYEYMKPICTTVIVSENVVVTTAICVFHFRDTERYRVYSGTASRLDGIPHTVQKIRHHPEFQNVKSGNLALVTIYPSINFRQSVNRKIKIYDGRRSPNIDLVNIEVHTCGWGRILGSRMIPDELRSITVPIISNQQCFDRHDRENIIPINDKVICTFVPNSVKHASMDDYGNPLVYINHENKERLLGILFYTRDNGQPDMYVNLFHPEYKAWIALKLTEIANNPP